MTRKNRTTRDAPISYRPPARLREEFHARVASSGLSANAFITAAVFSADAPRARRSPKLDRQMVAMLLSQAARINDHLRSVNATTTDQQAGLLRECRDELSEIRTCLMHLLGRDP
jgi:hypothetical protein